MSTGKQAHLLHMTYWKLRLTLYYFLSLSHVWLLFQQEERVQQVKNLIPNERLVRNSLVRRSSLIINFGIVQFLLSCLPTIYEKLRAEIDDLKALLKHQTAKVDKLVNQISFHVMKPSPQYWYTFPVQSTLTSADEVQSTLLKMHINIH